MTAKSIVAFVAARGFNDWLELAQEALKVVALAGRLRDAEPLPERLWDEPCGSSVAERGAWRRKGHSYQCERCGEFKGVTAFSDRASVCAKCCRSLVERHKASRTDGAAYTTSRSDRPSETDAQKPKAKRGARPGNKSATGVAKRKARPLDDDEKPKKKFQFAKSIADASAEDDPTMLGL